MKKQLIAFALTAILTATSANTFAKNTNYVNDSVNCTDFVMALGYRNFPNGEAFLNDAGVINMAKMLIDTAKVAYIKGAQYGLENGMIMNGGDPNSSKKEANAITQNIYKKHAKSLNYNTFTVNILNQCFKKGGTPLNDVVATEIDNIIK